MNIVGLMLIRDESWVLDLSARAALRWCDGLVVTLHNCRDASESMMRRIAGEASPRKPVWMRWNETTHWDEMQIRQEMLERGREMGGTHFAIVDADEVLTANFLPHVRGWFESLQPGQLLDLPMVAVWGNPTEYRHDGSVWARSWLTLGFRDKPDLAWKPRDMGYQHHNRPPHGALASRYRPVEEHGRGGVFHLQFLNRRRLLAKHWLYAYVDHLRWPGRETPEQLSRKYSQALDEKGIKCEMIPEEWWGDYSGNVDLMSEPWHEKELRRLIMENGEEKFRGINLVLPRPT